MHQRVKFQRNAANASLIQLIIFAFRFSELDSNVVRTSEFCEIGQLLTLTRRSLFRCVAFSETKAP